MKWLIALMLAACPAPTPAPQPPPPAPTGPPGEVIGQGDPSGPDGFDDRDGDRFDDRDGDGDRFDDRDGDGDRFDDRDGDGFDGRDSGDDDVDDFDAPAPAPAPTPAPADTKPAKPIDPEPPKLRGILRAHNQARAAHCAAPLTWSPKLAAVAQSWADSLASRGCAFEHSRGNRYGENLAFAAPAGTHDPRTTTSAWVREVSVYDFSNPQFSFEAGHFTQVVWRRTTTLGCGYAACAGGRGEIWVCNYDPPGNMSGAFRENVLPASCKK